MRILLVNTNERIILGVLLGAVAIGIYLVLSRWVMK